MAKLKTNSSGVTLGSNLELMQLATTGDFGTCAICTTLWQNLELMKILATNKVNPVSDSVAWVRCAPGNVYDDAFRIWHLQIALVGSFGGKYW